MKTGDIICMLICFGLVILFVGTSVGRLSSEHERIAIDIGTVLKNQQVQQVATLPPKQVAPKGIADLLRAMAIVESGSTADSDVLGDNGRSLGPLQIGQAYWTDASMPDGDYEDCTSYDYACRVAVKYWMRYCHEALCERDYATLARIHNGGPRGHCKKATLKYWAKVQKELQ